MSARAVVATTALEHKESDVFTMGEAVLKALDDAGYAVVPKEPTKKMRKAAQHAHGDHSPHEEWLEDEWPMLRRVYQFMVGVADGETPEPKRHPDPPPQGTGQGGRGEGNKQWQGC